MRTGTLERFLDMPATSTPLARVRRSLDVIETREDARERALVELSTRPAA
jgi:hypothetical protein